MNWRLSHRFHMEARLIADRHYNRQKPGTPQFAPPGSCLVLVADGAVWITSWPFAEYVKHAWPGAWINSCFRRESGPQASELIKEAIACTRWWYGDPPKLGMVTFVDAAKVEHKREPGRCYKLAGFRRVGMTKGGLIAWQMLPEDMPEPEEPLNAQLELLTTVGGER